MPLTYRATISNMSPEFGSTCAIFPIDDETLRYVRLTGRGEESAKLIEAYAKAQGLFWTKGQPDPEFTDTLSLDLGTVEPTLSGPKRPQDKILLKDIKPTFAKNLAELRGAAKSKGELKGSVPVELDGQKFDLKDGAVVIAAITSCTNTSNPYVMIAAGLVARNARKRGLSPKPWVKTSLAPGSKVVTQYLKSSELLADLEALKFNVVGYGCTTCIGNSGPLPDAVDAAIREGNLIATSVLSGNRNFEGRIHPQVRGNYLASPPLVVAYALAGRMDMDIQNEPLGQDPSGKDVFLKDIWPSPTEVAEMVQKHVTSAMFTEEYASVFEGDERWKEMPVPKGNRFAWDPKSTYVRLPTFFENMPKEPAPLKDIHAARALLVLGDSVTTDHISPAGSIPKDGAAAKYLNDNGVAQRDFNSFGARRGNHEVMMRGTFGNVRLKNLLAPGTEGSFSRHLPSGTQGSVYDVSMKYQGEGTPLVVLAGKEYGSGSSRDWAAKGTWMLGIQAVIADSYERIHRSNLIGMGVLPLQYAEGVTRESLGLSGEETFEITGVTTLKPGKTVQVVAKSADGKETKFDALARIDTSMELDYYRHGGILQYVLRQLLAG
ncbi:MAG TPA: aconitate hydratase AcnA [Polyangiaceae bacterium]|nr:aconitate hydratase AcnA [Polyangiaceae bacterium]